MFSFYTHNRHGQKSRENLGGRGTLPGLAQPPGALYVAVGNVVKLERCGLVDLRDYRECTGRVLAPWTVGIPLFHVDPIHQSTFITKKRQ
jgi:hypothetical protein